MNVTTTKPFPDVFPEEFFTWLAETAKDKSNRTVSYTLKASKHKHNREKPI